MIETHLQVIQHFQANTQYMGNQKKKIVVKQKIWEFIRRNKYFRVGDLIAIFEIKPSYAKWLIWFFTKAGVIELIHKDKKYTNRLYRLKKDIGIKAPKDKR